MRYFYCLFLLLSVASAAHAQDVILFTNGQELSARVLTIAPERITYLLPAAPTDTLFVLTPDVFMVRYANGTKELLHTATVMAAPAPTPEQFRVQGENDAIKYFKAPGAFWGTFAATLVTTPVYYLGGIAAGAGIAASKPKLSNMKVPDKALLQNPSYVSGYQKQAQRKKLGKAAAGFGVGVGASVVAVVVIIAVALTTIH